MNSQGSKAAGIQKGWFPAGQLQTPGSSVNPGTREAGKQGGRTAWVRVREGRRPVLGVTQWSWAKTLPHNSSSALHPQPHSYSHHRLLAPLARSLAKALVSAPTSLAPFSSPPQPGPCCRPGLRSEAAAAGRYLRHPLQALVQTAPWSRGLHPCPVTIWLNFKWHILQNVFPRSAQAGQRGPFLGCHRSQHLALSSALSRCAVIYLHVCVLHSPGSSLRVQITSPSSSTLF